MALFFCALTIVAGLLGLHFFGHGNTVGDAGGQFFLVIFFFVFLAISIGMVLRAFRFNLILQPDCMEYQGALTLKSVRRSQIRNWRFQVVKNSKYLELTLADPGGKRVRISLPFKPDAEFEAWFADLPNRDLEELRQSEESIKSDPAFGATPEERLDKAVRAKKFASQAQVGVIFLFVWSYIFPQPYQVLIVLIAAMPWIALVAVRLSHGLYTVGNVGKNNARPDITLLMLGPVFLLALRASADVHMFAWTQAIIPGVVLGIVIVFVLGMSLSWFSGKMSTALAFCTGSIVYAVAAIILSNSMLDHSQPTVYALPILGKHSTTGKGAKAYFLVPPWGRMETTNNIDVGFTLYRSKQVGDVICTRSYQGALRLPWFEVGDCRPEDIPAKSES